MVMCVTGIDMPPSSFYAALVQHSCSGDNQANRRATEAGILEAKSRGAQLVLLQELHDSLYFCQEENPALFDLAQPIPGEQSQWLSRLAKELGLVLVGSMFERRAPGLYHNSALVFDSDGELKGRYRKMHIPDDPGYHEKFYFTPGDGGFEPVETSLGVLGVLVCWDQWYPEAARLMALAGADILLYPTAIGWDKQDNHAEQQRQYDAWFTIQRGHAIANGIPLLSCNRCGFESKPGSRKKNSEGIQFWGGSFICGPQGEILARASQDKAEVLCVPINLRRSEEVRRIWPYLRDRRIDAYADLNKRYRD